MNSNNHRKINILYISRTSKITGPENILIDLLLELDKKTFLPIVILPDKKGLFYQKLRQNNINVLVKKIPFLRITYNPFLLFWFLISVFILNIDLFFTLKRFKTDIVVCNTIQEAIFLGVPVKINDGLLK